MAVVGKKRKAGITFYVATWWNDRQWWEPAGKDRREADRLDQRRKREIEAGTFQPPGSEPTPDRPTVQSFSSHWGGQRENASAADDRRNLGRFTALDWFACMALPDVRPRHVIGALKQLRSSGITEKTLKNAYGTFRTMCRDAVIAEAIQASPCVLPRNFFEGAAAVEREIYTRAEAAVLVSHHLIPSPVRVLNALCLLGGLREGEACGRRWRDLDPDTAPLMAMAVGTQYGGRELKTKKPRKVPVHPELRVILDAWAEGDFQALMGRLPLPEDYIVPYLSNRSAAGHYTRSIYYKAFQRGCAAAGIRARSLHSTRHTMVTLARRGGADRQVLSKVTHNAKGEIIDCYTHHDWEPLCATVLAIGSLFDARPSPRRLGDNPEESHHDSGGAGAHILAGSVVGDTRALSSIPGASTHNSREKQGERQSERYQRLEDSARIGDLLAPGDDDRKAFEIALAEQAEARPPAKTRPVGFVARKRGNRAG